VKSWARTSTTHWVSKVEKRKGILAIGRFFLAEINCLTVFGPPIFVTIASFCASVRESEALGMFPFRSSSERVTVSFINVRSPLSL